MRSRRALALTALAVLLAGCSFLVPWPRLYSGDGDYVEAPGMHQVRLGEVRLDRPGVHELAIEHLGPAWEWTVGFRVEARDEALELYVPDSSDLRPELVPAATVRLVLTNDRGETVFDAAGPLDAWDWNWNHARKPGDGEEYQAGPSSYRFRRFDVGPDGGWGTEFTPRYSSRYTLRCEVLEPAPVSPATDVWLTVETYWAGP